MRRLQEMIDELSKRADDRDLIALLATSRQGRFYNAALARELRHVIEALRRELDRRQASVLRQPSEGMKSLGNLYATYGVRCEDHSSDQPAECSSDN